MRRPTAFLISLVSLTLLGVGFPAARLLDAAEDAAKPAAAPKAAEKPKAGADPKATEKKAETGEEKPAAAEGDVLKQWAQLQARHKKIIDTVTQLQNDFLKADDAGKKEIAEKFQKLVPGLQKEMQEIQPKMLKLAPQVFKKDPSNTEAAEVVVSQFYQQNQYSEIIAVADRLIDEGKATSALLTFAGIAHFATHDFAKAEKILKQAEKQAEKTDKDLFRQVGAPFLASTADYMDLWKKEQEVRAAEAKADDLPRVSFKTNKGEIVLELFENEAPNTVANFISLVEAKKYDGIVFHRVIPNFMAQGGDPNTLDEDPNNDGSGGPGYTIACECYAENARKHFQGSLSMAHAGKDTGGSQFFLTHLPTAHLNPSAEEQRGHTVFGRIIKGMEVAGALKMGDKIETATVIRKRNHPYVPKKTADAAPAKESGRLKLKKSTIKDEEKPKSEKAKEEK